MDRMGSPLWNPSDTECEVLFGAPLDQNMKPSLGLLWFSFRKEHAGQFVASSVQTVKASDLWGSFETECEDLSGVLLGQNMEACLGFLWNET